MKSTIKNIISLSAQKIGLNSLVKLSNQRLILPFYHTVSDEELIHIKHLYPVTSDARFKSDLNFLQHNFNPISSSALIQKINQKESISENAFFLSFDDGFRQFADVVAPILLERGIPATCFVNTAFIDNKDMFYRLKVSILIEKINKKTLTDGQHKIISELLNLQGIIFKKSTDLLQITDINKSVLEEIAVVLEVSFTEYLAENQPYLTTNQLQELVKKGFSIGTHSVSHPDYMLLSENGQVQETVDCMRCLTENLGLKERLFSFPYTDFGIRKSFFEKIGNDIDLTFGTASLKLDEIPTNLQRIPMENAQYNSGVEIIKSEYLYFILKKIVGKHIIYRN